MTDQKPDLRTESDAIENVDLEHEFDTRRREDTHGVDDDTVRCICGEWEWDANDSEAHQRWAEHAAGATS